MNNNKIRHKTVVFVIIVVGIGLIFAVYFTDFGKSQLTQNSQSIEKFNQTAIPTIFAKSSKIPSVELVSAHADRKLLEITFKIYGLDTNINPTDWICNPYIRIDKPVQHRLSEYSISPVDNESGTLFQATYGYEIKAEGYNSLAISLDLTIGPCADYLNFQETNVTPSTLPDLIGNYHLSFQVPVQ